MVSRCKKGGSWEKRKNGAAIGEGKNRQRSHEIKIDGDKRTGKKSGGGETPWIKKWGRKTEKSSEKRSPAMEKNDEKI